MDRIIKALLSEFASQNSLDGLPEDKQFEHFGAYLALNTHYSDSFDTRDLVLGAGGDTGLDAIAVIVNGTLVSDVDTVEELAEINGYVDAAFIFVQTETSAGFDGQKISNIGFGAEDFFSETPKMVRNQEVTDAAEIMEKIYGLSGKFKRGNPSIFIYYFTTGRWTGDQNLEFRRSSVVENLAASGIFTQVEFVPVDAQGIQRMYNESKNAIVRSFTFADRTVVPEIKGVDQAYLGFIPAIEFLNLVEDSGGEILKGLFYDNVRDWQDYNAVNSGMRDTLADVSTRARFVLMNNGITVIAKTLRPTGNKFYIEDYQIVNGCQTSHVLWLQKDNIDDSVMVPLRLIATSDEEIITSIITATNRQTEVKEEQLLALSDFQKRLEQFFKSFDPSQNLYYERRSRQYNGASIEKTRIFTPANLIKAYASMFLNEPHSTTRSYRNLLARVGNTIFVSEHKLDPYYVAAYAYYKQEFLFRNQILDAKYKPARFHIILAVRILIQSDAPPRENSREMERYCKTILDVLWDATESIKIFERAAALVESVANGNFDRDHIRTQPFTQSVQKAAIGESASTTAKTRKKGKNSGN